MKFFLYPYKEEHGPIKTEELSLINSQFGIKVIKGEPGKISSSGYLIELYSEDDGNYFHMGSFDAFWLTDLEELVNDCKKLLDPTK